MKVTCQCGAKFRAKRENAGKRTRCPECKSPLLIPKAQPGQQMTEKPEERTATRPKKKYSIPDVYIVSALAITFTLCVGSFYIYEQTGSSWSWTLFITLGSGGFLFLVILGGVRAFNYCHICPRCETAWALKVIDKSKEGGSRMRYTIRCRECGITFDRVATGGK